MAGTNRVYKRILSGCKFTIDPDLNVESGPAIMGIRNTRAWRYVLVDNHETEVHHIGTLAQIFALARQNLTQQRMKVHKARKHVLD